MNKLLKYTNADGKSMLINGIALRTDTFSSSLDTLNFFVNCNQPTAYDFYNYLHGDFMSYIQGMPVILKAFSTTVKIRLYFFDPNAFKSLMVINGVPTDDGFSPTSISTVDGTTTPTVQINAGSFAGKTLKYDGSEWLTTTRLLSTRSDLPNISWAGDCKDDIEDIEFYVGNSRKLADFYWEEKTILKFALYPSVVFPEDPGTFITIRTNKTTPLRMGRYLKFNSPYLAAAWVYDSSSTVSVDLSLFEDDFGYYEITLWNVSRRTLVEAFESLKSLVPTEFDEEDPVLLYFAESLESKLKKCDYIRLTRISSGNWVFSY